jgi:hypothetical protein
MSSAPIRLLLLLLAIVALARSRFENIARARNGLFQHQEMACALQTSHHA